jgi:hypothetical protein
LNLLISPLLVSPCHVRTAFLSSQHGVREKADRK